MRYTLSLRSTHGPPDECIPSPDGAVGSNLCPAGPGLRYTITYNMQGVALLNPTV